MGSAGQRRRRSVDSDRRRDPEGSHRAILEAARAEFGEHGFAGSRVARIAEKAGVSHQLITYHFGGKQGLYDAVKSDWNRTSKKMIGEPAPFDELIRSYVEIAYRQQPWARVVVREELEGSPPLSAERIADLSAFVEQTRERQARGEIRDDLDAGALTLAFFAAAIAPIILPAQASVFIEADPLSPEFAERYADELAKIMHALARPTAVDEGFAEDAFRG